MVIAHLPASALATAIAANATVINEKSAASGMNRAYCGVAVPARRGGYNPAAELRGVAQLAEHRSPKPGVGGSSPSAPVEPVTYALQASCSDPLRSPSSMPTLGAVVKDW